MIEEGKNMSILTYPEVSLQTTFIHFNKTGL